MKISQPATAKTTASTPALHRAVVADGTTTGAAAAATWTTTSTTPTMAVTTTATTRTRTGAWARAAVADRDITGMTTAIGAAVAKGNEVEVGLGGIRSLFICNFNHFVLGGWQGPT